MPDMALQQELRDMHVQALQGLCKEYRIPAAQMHMLDGEPGNRIVELAGTLHSDVVIMGSIQRGRFERLALGSVAERLLDRLDCDVLALKPDGFRARLLSELDHPGSADG
jgi:universal stress protein E